MWRCQPGPYNDADSQFLQRSEVDAAAFSATSTQPLGPIHSVASTHAAAFRVHAAAVTQRYCLFHTFAVALRQPGVLLGAKK